MKGLKRKESKLLPSTRGSSKKNRNFNRNNKLKSSHYKFEYREIEMSRLNKGWLTLRDCYKGIKTCCKIFYRNRLLNRSERLNFLNMHLEIVLKIQIKITLLRQAIFTQAVLFWTLIIMPKVRQI